MTANEPKPSRMSPAEKAKAFPKNPKLAIAAYCYHNCLGQDEVNSHTTKFEVKNCECTNCHLWPFRGWQTMTGGTVTSMHKKDR